MPEFEIHWLDHGREPQCAPDLRYPNGMDLDLSEDAALFCLVRLPYPAKRCGAHLVRCKVCGISIVITAAGRVDDPKSLKLPCWRSVMDNVNNRFRSGFRQ